MFLLKDKPNFRYLRETETVPDGGIQFFAVVVLLTLTCGSRFISSCLAHQRTPLLSNHVSTSDEYAAPHGIRSYRSPVKYKHEVRYFFTCELVLPEYISF